MIYSYIIGNGFDRAHGMPTGYGHFKRWLIENNRYDVIGVQESAYPIKKDDKYLLWSDFEKAIGEYDIDTVLNWSWDNLYLTVDSLDNMVFNKGFIDTQLPDIIDEAFSKWVTSIHIADKVKFDISQYAFYFTFNYTDTLEQLYGIPENQVLHIHGRATMDEKLIAGHNKEIDPLAFYDENIGVHENNERVQRLADMNALCKPYQELIEKNESFFKDLSKVMDVHVIGHSCAEVDYPYFSKIINSVAMDANWHFNLYSDDDVQRIVELRKTFGIS